MQAAVGAGSCVAAHARRQPDPADVLLLPAAAGQVKNVTGRLLVGLRWWNEGNSETGEAWRFESLAEVRARGRRLH